MLLTSSAATCAPYYTTPEFKRGHPDSLVGEWREPGTARTLKLWADGRYGRCGMQAFWGVAAPGKIGFQFCFGGRAVAYNMTADGELVIEDGPEMGHYRRAANLTTCGDTVDPETREEAETRRGR